jgi:hypothetical protein
MTDIELADRPTTSAASISPLPYTLPDKSFDDWAGHQQWDYQPTARQLIVIEAVRTARSEGLYYTNAVQARCAVLLKPTAEQLAVRADKVEGGEFGMDCYYARCYLDAQAVFAKVKETFAQLQPVVGMRLGTLVFSDSKRTTGVTVVGIDGYSIEFTGRRGSSAVTGKGTTLQISFAMDRAADRGLRKDNFLAFIASR